VPGRASGEPAVVRRGAVPVGLSARSRLVPQPGQKWWESSTGPAQVGQEAVPAAGAIRMNIRQTAPPWGRPLVRQPELHYRSALVSPDRPHGGERKRDTLRLPAGSKGDAIVSPPRPPAGAGADWALQCHVAGHGSLQRTPLRPLPFRLGRAQGSSLVLSSDHVSKNHAEIYSDGETLRVKDLGSRNGTYLNRQLVGDAPLHEGDQLRLGDHSFTLVRNLFEEFLPGETLPLETQLSAAHVRELIDRGAATSVFQPIVALPSGEPTGLEALGRGLYPGLPSAPAPLLDLAGVFGPGAQAELSRLFRRRAVELAAELAPPPLLFLNTHPAEFESPGLLESIEGLRALAPAARLVLEIHESTLGQVDFLGWLTKRLDELGVQIAYDDFGAGEARLFELAEVPPHFLKFDRRLAHGIREAPASRQRLVAALAAAARELAVATIAEGVECREDAEACARAGFTHAQGFLFGRPAPLRRP
jgi:EAL domain-containing protein (putative c-di-GMP-specific phosphodiesterase class I)